MKTHQLRSLALRFKPSLIAQKQISSQFSQLAQKHLTTDMIRATITFDGRAEQSRAEQSRAEQSRAEQSRIPKTAVQFLSIIYVIGLFVWIAYAATLMRVRSSPPRFLVISSRSFETDLQLRNIAAMGTVTYIRAETDFAKAIGKAAQVKGQHDLAVIEDSNGKLTATYGETAVNSALARKYRNFDDGVPSTIFLGTALIAAWLGILLPAYKILPQLLVVSAVALTAKSVTVCTQCGDDLAKVTLNLAGLAIVVLAVVFSLWGRDATTRLTLGCTTAIAFGQLGLMYIEPTTQCFPCLLSLLCIGPVMGSLWRPLKQFGWFVSWKSRIAILPVAVVASVVFFGAQLSETAPNLGNAGTNRVALIGLNIRDVLGKAQVLGAEVICLSKSTCEPCVEAKSYFDKPGALSVRFLELPESRTVGGTPATKNEIALRSIPTPTFLVLAKDGSIIEQFSGWSNDELWIRGLVSNLTNSLQFAAKRKKQ